MESAPDARTECPAPATVHHGPPPLFRHLRDTMPDPQSSDDDDTTDCDCLRVHPYCLCESDDESVDPRASFSDALSEDVMSFRIRIRERTSALSEAPVRTTAEPDLAASPPRRPPEEGENRAASHLSTTTTGEKPGNPGEEEEEEGASDPETAGSVERALDWDPVARALAFLPEHPRPMRPEDVRGGVPALLAFGAARRGWGGCRWSARQVLWGARLLDERWPALFALAECLPLDVLLDLYRRERERRDETDRTREAPSSPASPASSSSSSSPPSPSSLGLPRSPRFAGSLAGVGFLALPYIAARIMETGTVQEALGWSDAELRPTFCLRAIKMPFAVDVCSSVDWYVRARTGSPSLRVAVSCACVVVTLMRGIVLTTSVVGPPAGERAAFADGDDDAQPGSAPDGPPASPSVWPAVFRGTEDLGAHPIGFYDEDMDGQLELCALLFAPADVPSRQRRSATERIARVLPGDVTLTIEFSCATLLPWVHRNLQSTPRMLVTAPLRYATTCAWAGQAAPRPWRLLLGPTGLDPVWCETRYPAGDDDDKNDEHTRSDGDSDSDDDGARTRGKTASMVDAFYDPLLTAYDFRAQLDETTLGRWQEISLAMTAERCRNAGRPPSDWVRIEDETRSDARALVDGFSFRALGIDWHLEREDVAGDRLRLERLPDLSAEEREVLGWSPHGT